MAPQPRPQLVNAPNFMLSAPVSSKTLTSYRGAQKMADLKDWISAEIPGIIGPAERLPAYWEQDGVISS